MRDSTRLAILQISLAVELRSSDPRPVFVSRTRAEIARLEARASAGRS